MSKSQPRTFASKFAEDVYRGLTTSPKSLPSRFIYDAEGDKLFQAIMAMPDYYLTDCEFEILDAYKAAIVDDFRSDEGFDLIELGAGDGKKTKLLLRELVNQSLTFTYIPVDISQHILDDLQSALRRDFPQVEVLPEQGTYFGVLEKISRFTTRKKAIVVLGSNIGNLLHEKAIAFLRNIQECMTAEDMLFMGFDQKKDPEIILKAYNDATGITAAFNKNILRRINRELGGNFVLGQFRHWETYNPETGTAASFLVSEKAQKVKIDSLDLTLQFEPWESIHVEISQKYDDSVVQWLADEAGLQIEQSYQDQRGFYKNYVFVKKR